MIEFDISKKRNFSMLINYSVIIRIKVQIHDRMVIWNNQ